MYSHTRTISAIFGLATAMPMTTYLAQKKTFELQTDTHLTQDEITNDKDPGTAVNTHKLPFIENVSGTDDEFVLKMVENAMGLSEQAHKISETED